MKHIFECRDGRGCKYFTGKGYCGIESVSKEVLYDCVGQLAGCNKYEEKPSEPTLKEKIEVMLSQEGLSLSESHKPRLGCWIDDKEEIKALLRDIVDDTLIYKLDVALIKFAKFIEHKKDIYKDLGIEECQK